MSPRERERSGLMAAVMQLLDRSCGPWSCGPCAHTRGESLEREGGQVEGGVNAVSGLRGAHEGKMLRGRNRGGEVRGAGRMHVEWTVDIIVGCWYQLL